MENLSLKELIELRETYKLSNLKGSIPDDSKLRQLTKKYFGQDNAISIYQMHEMIQYEILECLLKQDSYVNLMIRLEEAVSVIRTGRRIIDSDYSDEVFRKWMIGLFHHNSIGCIGCDEDIPERVIQFDIWKD